MDDTTLAALVATAALIGFVHTITGPDHYVPFVAMSRVGGWSLRRTIAVTLLCGVGHVLSSIALGCLGIGLGWWVGGIERFESVRGSIAGWMLLGFGLAYLVWGIHRAIRNRPHTHSHVHGDGLVHAHEHAHRHEHAHVHTGNARATSMTPWILFTIFVFGPCEPLIPILMYPAARLSIAGVAIVAAVFAAVTLVTMTAIVVPLCLGLTKLPLGGLARYGHALAGFVVAACGAAIQLGL